MGLTAKKKMLVTGGAGFIGSNFIRHMLSSYSDYDIINLDLLTYAGNLENLKEVEGDVRYHFIKGDISDMGLLESIFETEMDYVVNFAAETHVDRSIDDPIAFVRTNVLGTESLLDCARRYGVGKFIQISTDEVYGALGSDGYFTEDTNLNPNSPYSASKAAADLLVRAYSRTYGLDVNITRCSNNYGPYQFPEKLIPLMIANSLEGLELPIYGDGLQIRDWLHVSDHCRAIDMVLHKGVPGEIYNIGGNNEKTNIDLVRFIINRTGADESFVRHVKDRLGHDRRYAIDSSKIRSELGWEALCSFEEGMEETIKWYVNNRQWWERIRSGDYKCYYDKMYNNR